MRGPPDKQSHQAYHIKFSVPYTLVAAFSITAALASGNEVGKCKTAVQQKYDNTLKQCWNRIPDDIERSFCEAGARIVKNRADKTCEGRHSELRKRDASLTDLRALGDVAKAVVLNRRDNCVTDPESKQSFCFDTGYLTSLGRKASETPCNSNNHGTQKCLPDGKGFISCVYDKWSVQQLCGVGTKCKTHPSSAKHVLCGW
ncbi:hypothetical protein BC832DRAFT_596262 [Gaertneriomyces semiglobifer]|nr:hypothetical protein BC832DRAFT_596262 [Gaertneriomyces semiglobifer]